MISSSKPPASQLAFAKYQGLGNDLIIIDARRNLLLPKGISYDELGKRLCDRHLGIGADGIVFLEVSTSCDFKMSYYNSDGTRSVCGNGERCLAAFVKQRSLVPMDQETFILETDCGNKLVRYGSGARWITVEMGLATFDPVGVPVFAEGEIVDFPIQVDGCQLRVTAVGLGNPHAVVFVEDLEDFDWKKYGSLIERHSLFPVRTNVQFVEIVNPAEVRARSWERGVGETLACGTGSAAILAAGLRLEKLSPRIQVVWPGGIASVVCNPKTMMLSLSGPAKEVYTGTIELSKFFNEHNL